MYVGLAIRVYSASKQARYYSGKENDEKNDHHRTPEQSDANRAALLALTAAIQLNESQDQQDKRTTEQPWSGGLDSDA
jgi:hypothetical protein